MEVLVFLAVQDSSACPSRMLADSSWEPTITTAAAIVRRSDVTDCQAVNKANVVPRGAVSWNDWTSRIQCID